MISRRTISDLLTERKLTIEQLAAAAGFEPKVVEAIAQGRYTTSPKHRQRLAAALDMDADQISWGGPVEVDHMYGHGPQFGRSP